MAENTSGPLRIVQLYPRDMNIYGDWGNTLTLRRRAERYGLDTEIVDYDPGDPWPEHADLFVGGGGQDSGQFRVAEDLAAVAPRLHEAVERGVPMLAICGLYQLFGRSFRTGAGETLSGIGIFDLETVAGTERLIGNIVTESPALGRIVGYENHSGLTHLGAGQEPLATVVSGAGNNGEDGTEGARTHNVLGSYLHGSLLPKNPRVADFLLGQALALRGESLPEVGPDDTLAERAREVAASRPR
ncbi:type 1 glutamine amidotransferase [Kocuria rhizophila]|uniref:type 1 glutamine amidotransferase n=2 Tax=Kocuria rhizophila TaxID=72000 RepID=UPI000C8768E4|nr:glutamine amidotransferase [Kocuria rhizophila]MCT2073185.1 glutamine amidotransferase [Kocuria rhizophila]PMR90077.1 glutamine amidotransferase [Kocuria rhizophila]